jgi:transcriptional regulator with XRE-family HTH domain
MNVMTTKPNSPLSASEVARAYLEESPENERLYRESEASAIIAQNMKLLRVTKGISQAELAKRIGRKQPFLARLELGGYDRCSVSTLRTVMRALGFDFDFAAMTKPIQAPVYTGGSSCDDLEAAFAGEDHYRRRIAEYTRENWVPARYPAPSNVSIAKLKSQRGQGPAA